jgi:hypothetical protein
MEDRENDNPRRIKAKKICFFIGVFIASLLFYIIVFHYNDFLGMGKQSWSQILNDLWFYAIGALWVAVIIYVKHF